ncbi:MAG: YdcF family protein [Pseudomonadales bacterium]|nr:YdcF family protein [Pseudomonadales bacterium]
METDTIKKSTQLWDYMSSFDQQLRSDAVVVCCSYDLRVCDHACNLIKSGISDKLILSGNTGNWTKHIWSTAEAIIFKERAIANGIDPKKIILETEATNFGENITLSKALLPNVKVVTFVTKPSALLRVKLTAECQWPEIKAYVSCPPVIFPHEISNVVGILGVINEMVGDIDRVQKYPDLGFQVPHTLPEHILNAWGYLKEQGFTEHLMHSC